MLRLLLTASAVVALAASSSPKKLLTTPVGLRNLGNTCYLNAQMQCAYNIPLVRDVILTESSSADETPEKTMARDAWKSLFRDMEQVASASPSKQVAAPRRFCAALGIPVMEQQDSQEFWKLLLPAVGIPRLNDLYQGAYQDYIVEATPPSETSSSTTNSSSSPPTRREKRRETSFLDLSLDVVMPSRPSERTDMEASLQQEFQQPELLQVAEGNGWRPGKGEDPVDAYKGMQLQPAGLPPILQFHLKRFQFDWMTETTSKINDPCTFPTVLNLAELCRDAMGEATSDDDESNSHESSILYDLQAVVIHAGKYGQGHYYAYVRPNLLADKPAANGGWYRCNDEIVEPVTLKEVLCDAYGGDQSGLLSQQAEKDASASDTQRGFWRRLLPGWLSGNPRAPSLSPFGYGGPTSSAYVVQYVRRNAIPKLYGVAAAEEDREDPNILPQ